MSDVINKPGTQSQELLEGLSSRIFELKELVKTCDPESALKKVMSVHRKTLAPLENIPEMEVIRMMQIKKAMQELNILQPFDLKRIYLEIRKDMFDKKIVNIIVEDLSHEANLLYAKLFRNLEDLRESIDIMYEDNLKNESLENVNEIYKYSTMRIMLTAINVSLSSVSTYTQKLFEMKGVRENSTFGCDQLTESELDEIKKLTFPRKTQQCILINDVWKIQKLKKSLDSNPLIGNGELKSQQCDLVIALRSDDYDIIRNALKELFN
jgi:hypothetical protein